MLLITFILLGILIPAVFIQVLVLKATVAASKKHRLTWKTAAAAVFVSFPFAIVSSILGSLHSESAVIIIAQILCLFCILILPALLLKRSLQISAFTSLGMVVVATIVSIIIGAGFAFGVRTYLVQAFRLPSGGMSPTLLSGDYILVNRYTYRLADPHKGETVVFHYPRNTSVDFIQRIVATGGETVEVKDKTVLVNGRPIANDRGANTDNIIQPIRDNMSLISVPKGSVFMLGDNRDNSADSRFWGCLERKHIIGRPFVIYWSYDPESKKIRTERIGMTIY